MKNQSITIACITVIFHFLIINTCYGQQSTQRHSSNGLSTVIFNTQLGKVTVFMPNFNANERFSGSLKISPEGRSKKVQEKNKSALQQFQLVLNNNPISLASEMYTLQNISNEKVVLQLRNEEGKVLLSSSLESPAKPINSNASVFIPPYIVVGDPARISAALDGLPSNNSVSLDGKSVSILAESETDLFFKVPAHTTGESTLSFTNNAEQIEVSLHVINLEIAVGKLSLLRSETTPLSINISGLEGLETDVPITITNNSPSNVSLENGNQQQININPEIDAPSGNYNVTQTIQATENGSYTISVGIVPPEAPSNENLLCHCTIGENSYFIAPEACSELGGQCSTTKNPIDFDDYNRNIFSEDAVETYNVSVPNIINFEDYEVDLVVQNYNDYEAAFFSFMPSGSNNWQSIENDYDATDELSAVWETPTANGFYEVKVAMVSEGGTTTTVIQSLYLNAAPLLETEDYATVSFTISEEEIKKALRKAEKTGDDIDELEDEISDHLDKLEKARKRRDENDDLANELIAIDEVLDSVQSTYEDELEDIINAINKLKKQLPEDADHDGLQNAVSNAQSRADDCEDQLEDLKNEQEALEEQLEKDKEALEEHFKSFKKIHEENGYDVSFSYDEDGNFTFKCKFNKGNGILQDPNDDEYREELYFELLKLKKKHNNTKKAIERIKEKIAAAEDDCEELDAALQEAKEAKATNDAKAAAALEADELCRQIKELLEPLLKWCEAQPDRCDFKDKIEALLKQCPKDSATLDDFWNDFNELLALKKALEDSLAKAAQDDQNGIDDTEDDISDLTGKKDALEDQQKKELEDADQLRKQREQEAAEDAAAAAARKAANEKKRKQQKEDDEKVKDLIRKAKIDDAGDEAFEDLLIGMGLDLLDEATGDLYLGKVIGGLLVLKDIPDCVCPLFKALRDAIAAKNRKAPEGVAVYVEAYIQKWKKCANVPSIASVSIAGPDLTTAINGMTAEQTKRALEALNQAIRIQCK